MPSASFRLRQQSLHRILPRRNQTREAIQEFKTAAALHTNPAFLAGLARTYALNGQPQEAKRAYDQLLAMPQPNSAFAYQAALYQLALGQGNKAMTSPEQAYNEHCWILLYLKVDPRVDPLRSDPRFKTLLQRVHYTS